MKIPKLFVAVDYRTKEEATGLIEQINNVQGDFGYKLNLDLLLLQGGLNVLDEFTSFGRPIFADLKMWNGRRTMASIVDILASKGVALTNIYAHAGTKFLKAAVEAIDGRDLGILGLTVLTHYTDEDCMRIYQQPLKESVRMLSEIAHEGECYGLVLPPTTLDVVKNLDMIKTTPGIRPKWYEKPEDNWQAQVATPSGAITAGANILVIGSPIRKDADPPAALKRTLDEIAQ